MMRFDVHLSSPLLWYVYREVMYTTLLYDSRSFLFSRGEHTYATAMHHRTLRGSGEYEDVCELTMTSSPAYQYSGTHINEGCM